MSRKPAPTLSQDLFNLHKSKSYFCDICIKCKNVDFYAHKIILLQRSSFFKDLIIAQSGLVDENASTKNQSSQKSCNENNLKTQQIVLYVDDISPVELSKVLDIIYGGNKEDKYISLRVKNQNLLRSSLEKPHKERPQPYRHTILDCEQPAIRRRNSHRSKNKQRFSMDERILSNLAPHKKQDGSEVNYCDHEKASLKSSSQTTLKTMSWNLKYVPNRLTHDIAMLLEHAENSADLKLVFNPPRSHQHYLLHNNRWNPQQYCVDNCQGNLYQAWLSRGIMSSFFSYKDRYEPVLCHKAIICARSEFLNRLIVNQEKKRSNQSDNLLTLEIDSGVIPPRYINVILYAMYTDRIDITRTSQGNREGAFPQGPGSSILRMRDAIELHHVASFIEFHSLVHGCEDLIVHSLEPSNLLQVLHWTTLPHGSQWVKRRLFAYMREKFTELTSTGVLYELSEADIIEVLQSDHVNASELDILKSVLRWGEYELLRRIEKREPHLVNHISHSMSRNKTASARRRELSSLKREELHECTAPVLKCVRTQHLLPYNHDVLVNAIKRGVISRPPAHLLEGFNERDGNNRAWIWERAGPSYIPPRLFLPYVEETKVILNERLAQESNGVSLRSVHRLSQDSPSHSSPVLSSLPTIPDTLYMIGQASPNPHLDGIHQTENFVVNLKSTLAVTKYIDGIYRVPDTSKLRGMVQRELMIRSIPFIKKLFRSCASCIHLKCNTYRQVEQFGDIVPMTDDNDDDAIYCNRCCGLNLIRKIVVRENDLPDSAVDLLIHPEKYYTPQEIQAIKSNKKKHTSLAKVNKKQEENEAPKAMKLSSPDQFSDELNQEFKELEIAMEQMEAMCKISPILYGRKPEDVPYNGSNENLIHPAHTDGEVQSCESSDVSSDEKFSSKKHKLKKLKPVAPSHPTSSGIAKNPATWHQKIRILEQTSIPRSQSSSEDEMAINIHSLRFRKRALSRRSSSSTNASFHSIPDVAASANSSLTRRSISNSLRRSPITSNACFESHPCLPSTYQNPQLPFVSSSSDQDPSSDEEDARYNRPLNDNIFSSRKHPPSYNLADECLKLLPSTSTSQQQLEQQNKEFNTTKPSTSKIAVKSGNDLASSSTNTSHALINVVETASTAVPDLFGSTIVSSSSIQSLNECGKYFFMSLKRNSSATNTPTIGQQQKTIETLQKIPDSEINVSTISNSPCSSKTSIASSSQSSKNIDSSMKIFPMPLTSQKIVSSTNLNCSKSATSTIDSPWIPRKKENEQQGGFSVPPKSPKINVKSETLQINNKMKPGKNIKESSF